jgi:succinate dehydrogenase / fumarate reductase membrane anchor subunit
MVKRYTKNPVGAHYGLSEWLLQRLTAVVMAVYTVFAFPYVVYRKPATYADWTAMFSANFFRLFTMFFIAALLYHAWVGVRDILMDYIRATGVRLVAQSAVGIVLFFYLIWSVSILWGRVSP